MIFNEIYFYRFIIGGKKINVMATADSESDNKSTSSPGKISIGDKETKVVFNQGKEIIIFVKIV